MRLSKVKALILTVSISITPILAFTGCCAEEKAPSGTYKNSFFPDKSITVKTDTTGTMNKAWIGANANSVTGTYELTNIEKYGDGGNDHTYYWKASMKVKSTDKTYGMNKDYGPFTVYACKDSCKVTINNIVYGTYRN